MQERHTTERSAYTRPTPLVFLDPKTYEYSPENPNLAETYTVWSSRRSADGMVIAIEPHLHEQPVARALMEAYLGRNNFESVPHYDMEHWFWGRYGLDLAKFVFSQFASWITRKYPIPEMSLFMIDNSIPTGDPTLAHRVEEVKRDLREIEE